MKPLHEIIESLLDNDFDVDLKSSFPVILKKHKFDIDRNESYDPPSIDKRTDEIRGVLKDIPKHAKKISYKDARADVLAGKSNVIAVQYNGIACIPGFKGIPEVKTESYNIMVFNPGPEYADMIKNNFGKHRSTRIYGDPTMLIMIISLPKPCLDSQRVVYTHMHFSKVLTDNYDNYFNNPNTPTTQDHTGAGWVSEPDTTITFYDTAI